MVKASQPFLKRHMGFFGIKKHTGKNADLPHISLKLMSNIKKDNLLGKYERML